MAKLGIAFAGAALGFFLGGPLGAQIGFSLGGLLGGALFPGKIPSGPRLQDLNVSAATNGVPIPIGYGTQRVPGNIIWAPPLVEHSKKQSVKGGPKQTTYSYTASFAVAFGEGPAQLGRVWFDSKIVYDPTGGSAGITAISQSGNLVTVTCTLNPDVGSQATIAGVGVSGYNGKWAVISTGPTSFTYYNTKHSGLAPSSGGTASIPAPAYTAPTIYTGTETQAPDPTIQAAEGAANVPAFRGLCYAVWENFDLSNFGNRIPNIRAEITFVSSTSHSTIFLDKSNFTSGGAAPIVNALTPSSADEFAIWMVAVSSSVLPTNLQPDVSWSSPFDNRVIAFYYKNVSDTSPISISLTNGGSFNSWASMLATFGKGAISPSIVQHREFPGTMNTGGTFNLSFVSNTTAGNTLLFAYYSSGSSSGSFGVSSVIDSQGNVYNKIGQILSSNGVSGGRAMVSLWAAYNTKGGPCIISPTVSSSGSSLGQIIELSGLQALEASLGDMVSDVCIRSGLDSSKIDVSAIANIPGVGYVITRPTTGADALKPLTLAFFFDGVESNGVMKFIPRGGAVQSLTVPETDLGLIKDNYKITEQFIQPQDIPREIQVLFIDKNLDYQQNKTHKRRHTRVIHTKQATVIELPLTLDATTAEQISEKALYLASLERQPYDMNLWKALYMLFDPTDVIQFTYEGLTFQMRIIKSSIGADFQTAISGVNENANTYLSSSIGSNGIGFVPAAPNEVPDTQLFLFDIPLLRDTDANNGGSGYYAAVSSIDLSKWPGVSVQKSSDNVNFAEEFHTAVGANYGTAQSILGSPRSPWTWDDVNTLTVYMTQGTLAGTSDINVLNGANALLVGSEVIQYGSAVQNPDGTFTISHLLRGRRGTEIYSGSHGASEIVVDLNSVGVVREAVGTSELQVLRYFRPVSYGQDISSVESQLFTNTGQDVMPYAVTSVEGTRDASYNLTVTWIRRTRIGGDWLNGIGTVPLSETVESYDVEILNGANVVRVFSALSSPTFTYSAVDQIADFGSVQSQIVINIYQNSGIIGRGFKKTTTV